MQQIKNYAANLKRLVRAADWFHSFVPLLMGINYLWCFLLKVSVSKDSFFLLMFFFLTTIGFASLGYFINDFFDQKTDLAAGKWNKLSTINPFYQLLLFVGILLLTFLPWIWLPSNDVTWLLIIFEVVLFLSYSLPFPRLKNKLLLSNIVDAGYAYLIPFILSYYTFCLFTEETVGPEIYLLAIAVFVIGFRNIFIHQINDALKDKITGLTTLPCYLTKYSSWFLLQLLLFLEWLLINLFSFCIVNSYPLVILWLVFYNGVIVYHAFRYKTVLNSFELLNHRERHFSDNINQIGFPILTLIILASYDLLWLILVPIHLTALTPKWIFHFPGQNIQWLRQRLLRFWRLQKDLVNVLQNAFRNYLQYLRLMVNYSIYYLFRLFGVDLKNENLSAVKYLKNKWMNQTY